MGCSPLLAKAKEGGHPMSKERAETHVSHGPPNPPCARSAMVGFMSISSSGRRLQLFKPRYSLRGVVVKTRFKRIDKQCCSRQKNLCSVLFWFLHLRQLRSRSCSAISGAQRARRRGRLRDLGSPPRSPAILKIEFLKELSEKTPDCHSKCGSSLVKACSSHD